MAYKPVGIDDSSHFSPRIRAALTAEYGPGGTSGNLGVVQADARYSLASAVTAALLLKADLNNPTFTGSVVVPTPTTSSAATSKGYVDSADALKANLASPTFTGTVTVPTPTVGGAAATKAYVDGVLDANNAYQYKGGIDCSANPNYPAADAGWTYKVTVAGKIGGASGIVVEVGDSITCLVDATAAGTQAAVGANWLVVQTNVDGSVIGPASSVSGNILTFSGTTGKVVQDSGKKHSTDGTFAANSDSNIPTEKAVKTYADAAKAAAQTYSTDRSHHTGTQVAVTISDLDDHIANFIADSPDLGNKADLDTSRKVPVDQLPGVVSASPGTIVQRSAGGQISAEDAFSPTDLTTLEQVQTMVKIIAPTLLAANVNLPATNTTLAASGIKQALAKVSTTYRVRWTLVYDADQATDIRIALKGPTGTVIDAVAIGPQAGVSGVTAQAMLPRYIDENTVGTSSSAPQFGGLSTGGVYTPATVVIEGWVTTDGTNTGDLELWFAQGTSGAGTGAGTTPGQIKKRGTTLKLEEAVPVTSSTPTLPTLTPYSAQDIHDRVLINGHLTFNGSTSPYKQTNQAAWLGKITSLSSTRVLRTNFDEFSTSATAGLAAMRTAGVLGLFTVTNEATDHPTDDTPTSVTATVNYLLARAYDVMWGVEGLNEPNQNRGDGSTTAGWETVTYDLQVAIWNACHDTTPRTDPITSASYTNAARFAALNGGAGGHIVGPSLHDLKAAANGGQHYIDLFNTGIASYQTELGLHRYTGGNVPLYNTDSRLGLVRQASAFGPGYPVVFTEFGYDNALGNTSTAQASEAAVATYAPRAILQFAAIRGITTFWYELLNLAADSANSIVNDNWGLVRVDNTDATNSGLWVNKPGYTAIHDFLAALDDPGATYTPADISVAIVPPVGNTDVAYAATRKRGADKGTVHLWRELSVWTPNTKTTVTVPTVDVVVTDSVGPRTIAVGADVVSVAMR